MQNGSRTKVSTLGGIIALVLVGVFSRSTPASAQQPLGFHGWGIRGGATVDPDQGHVGVHINAGEFARRVRFQPSFEVGFGSGLVVGAVNLDAVLIFRKPSWQPYLGGGLGVAVIDSDRNHDSGDEVDVEAGLNLVGGFEWGRGRRYLLELRVGIGDIPELKVTAGIDF